MKILQYGINFHPELTGTGKYTGEMARWLSQLGHEVDVVTAPPYYPDWKVAQGYSAGRYKREIMPRTNGRVQIMRCPLWVPGEVTGASRLLHLASFAASSVVGLTWAFARKPDMLFLVAPTFFQVPFALLYAKLTGTPCWLHIQDFEVDAALGMGIVKGGLSKASWPRRVAWGVESFFLKRFDRISTITPAMMKLLECKGVKSEQTVLLPNWVGLKHIQPLPREQSMRQELGIADDEVVVLYSGNMGEKQGLELLMEAAALLKDKPHIQFVLAGTGSARDRLEQASTELGNVRWLPLQPFERLGQFLAVADVHVLPQRADAADLVMPSKLTGMLASGRAIVGTATASTQLGKLLQDVGVRVEPGDAKAVARAIEFLAGRPETRAEMGRLARRHAEETLDQDHILNQFVREVQTLLVTHPEDSRTVP